MTRLKYLDPADGQYKLLPVGGGSGGAEEVVISAGVLPTKSEELWVDTSATYPVYDWSYADNRYLGSGFRNVIRNGDCSIAQRGNGPFSGLAYTMDGWRLSYSGGTVSVNRVPAVAGEASARGTMTVSGQSAAGDHAQVLFLVEDVNTLSGKTVTLSFDAWASSGTPKIGVELQQYFGTGGTPSATQNTHAGAITISTTRTRYSTTFTVPSVAGASLGTNGNHCLTLGFWVSAGSNFLSRAGIGIQSGTFNITDVQLEAGAAATAFERLPVQQQLAWCQRYFQRYGVGNPSLAPESGYNQFALGMVSSSTGTAYFYNTFPVLMRTNPTVSTSAANTFIAHDGSTAYTLTGMSIAGLASDHWQGFVSGPTPVFTAYRPMRLMANNTAAAFMDFSAEL